MPALTGRTQVLLQPKHKQGEYYTNSSGIRVVSQAGAEAGARIGDIDNNDWISFNPDGTIRNNGKCFDATGGSSTDGTQLIIWTGSGGANQRWTLS
ncbi:MAG: ricin-type beta-trefoil lectin domain protein [Actinophytocola sp.]|uniref:ricin-type beta-trefoil lectin domain protein n=1 Tax=Actinophytocola sp. TaxID=1872138 RepID=UPI003C71FF19